MSNDIKVKELVALVAEEKQANTAWSDDFMSVRNTKEYKKVESELLAKEEIIQSESNEANHINIINKIIEHETRQYKKYLGETDPSAPSSASQRESGSRLKPWYIRLKERFF